MAARLLKRASYDVRLHLLGDRAGLKGDAAEMARWWDGPVRAMDASALQSMHLVIDALFGAGLSRAPEGAAAEMIDAINDSGLPVLAVDVPSGLDGTTGDAPGAVVQATRTVTFFRKKPAHLLLPGRILCGDVVLADIGIPPSILTGDLSIGTFENAPMLWSATFPRLRIDAHKYTRGHAVVVSGPAFRSGAARLSARAALRAGAGLVTVASPPSALPENAAHLTAVMISPCESPSALARMLEDKRKNVVLIGRVPGSEVKPRNWSQPRYGPAPPPFSMPMPSPLSQKPSPKTIPASGSDLRAPPRRLPIDPHRCSKSFASTPPGRSFSHLTTASSPGSFPA